MKPNVGRIVHYCPMTEGDVSCCAAIVTEVNGETVNLSVFFVSHTAPVYGVPHDESKKSHSWHWPEREE